METLSYSCINFAIMFWLIQIINNTEFKKNHINWVYIFSFIILFIMPVIWPILASRLLKIKFFRGYIIQPIPRSWDHFFGKAEPCFILVHLKDSRLIGGLYYTDSYASSFPYKEDLYLEEVWKVDDKGKFISKIQDTKGVWISKDCFDFIEFFQINYKEDESND